MTPSVHISFLSFLSLSGLLGSLSLFNSVKESQQRILRALKKYFSLSDYTDLKKGFHRFLFVQNEIEVAIGVEYTFVS